VGHESTVSLEFEMLNKYRINRGVKTFFKNLGATSKFQAPEANHILKNHKYKASQYTI